MADRVFPNNTQVNMGSKIEFNGVDWSNVKSNMNNMRLASDEHTSKIIELISKLTGVDEADITEVIDDAKTVEFKGDENDGMEKGIVDTGDEIEDVIGEEDAHEGGMPESFGESSEEGESDGAGDEFVFNSPDEINADAIERAAAAGDKKRVKAILAARKINRTRIASVLEEKMKTAKASADAQRKQTAVNAVKRSTASTQPVADEFVSPSKFTKAQRNSFRAIALAKGMPREYVDSMCPVIRSAKSSEVIAGINQIANAEMSLPIKLAAITGLIKGAGLDATDKKEVVDYWTEVFGSEYAHDMAKENN